MAHQASRQPHLLVDQSAVFSAFHFGGINNAANCKPHAHPQAALQATPQATTLSHSRFKGQQADAQTPCPKQGWGSGNKAQS